ncbi:hypothetical protein BHYA_0094g00130 [Botrytis hyacinthi]|uniref:Heterokaryon incompatibility domain-containing protein n=1 Tax=Botrytis hyacinthi TaxID=278943 RepID=A0A4Z1GS30_9HELO|nr:hypothetical protein BHYA_0094g00130 [Botrytis hyacinthi]
MADVYGGASLTIAAEAAIDTASGIFDSTNIFRQQQSQKFNFSVKGYHPVYPRDSGRLYLRDSVDLQPSTLKSCLKNRAWALQEDLMSRRLISFGKEQLYWRCVTQELIEAYPSQPLNSIKLQLSEGYHTDFVCRDMKSGKTTLPSWYSIVNDYATRHISVQNDLLVGISAIAKVMAKEMEQPSDAYKAGLWEHDFHEGLLWRRPHECDRPLIRHAEYIAPSWSWASISASDIPTRRIYENKVTGDAICLKDAKILEIIIENENDDHFGIVRGGYVKLSGPTLEICRHLIPSIFWDCPENAEDATSCTLELVYDEYVSEDSLPRIICVDSHPKVLLVIISTFPRNFRNALILQNTGSLDVYERVGRLEIRILGDNFLHPDWTTREITII